MFRIIVGLISLAVLMGSTPAAAQVTYRATGIVYNSTATPWPVGTAMELVYTEPPVAGTLRMTIGNDTWTDTEIYNSTSSVGVRGYSIASAIYPDRPALLGPADVKPGLGISLFVDIVPTVNPPTPEDLQAAVLNGNRAIMDLRFGLAFITGPSISSIVQGQILSVERVQEIPALTCAGFTNPFDEPILLKKKTNRAIPLRIRVQNAGTDLSDTTIPGGAAPVVNVSYSAGTNVPAVDVSAELVNDTAGSTSNAFIYDPATGYWGLNLSTKNQTAAGTYVVTVKPGSAAYTVTPTCTGIFVRSD